MEVLWVMGGVMLFATTVALVGISWVRHEGKDDREEEKIKIVIDRRRSISSYRYSLLTRMKRDNILNEEERNWVFSPLDTKDISEESATWEEWLENNDMIGDQHESN